MPGPFESEEARIKEYVKNWLQDIDESVKSLRDYMHDITRESRFMVDEFASEVSAKSTEIKPTSREPVVYEFIVAATGIAGTLLLGTRRRIPIPVGVTAIPVKMRLYENDQRILMTGTPEAPGAASALFLEMTGHEYPHITY